MARSSAVHVVALSILALSGAPASSAVAPGEAARPGRLAPGEYRVTSIEAWGDRGESMLDASAWERVEVRKDGERWKLVIHYKGNRTSAFDLRPGGKFSPGTWHANQFAVYPSSLKDGGTTLKMHFCYRGFVNLTLREKGDSPAAP